MTFKILVKFLSHSFQAKELPTLKDNDFINEGQKIYIDDNNKKVFLEKLKKDVEVRKKNQYKGRPHYMNVNTVGFLGAFKTIYPATKAKMDISYIIEGR